MRRRAAPKAIAAAEGEGSFSEAPATPGRVIELAGEKEVQLFTGRVLLDELTATLAKKKLAKYVAATSLSVNQMLASYRRIATLVAVRQLDAQVSRDPDDDAVLACALAARADLIVSGDDDLLSLKSFNGIPIVTVAQAVKGLAPGHRP
jgi:putative PIN family toxin of toxin-antitoxin system